MIGILTAVREELKPLLRKMPSVDVESTGGILFHRGFIAGKQVVVARSGIGRERAATAARILIERYHPDSVLCIGFAAGLRPDVVPGDLILATSIAESLVPDDRLVGIAAQTRGEDVAVHSGPLLCVDQVVHSVEEKYELAARFPNSVGLDMESAGIAAAASNFGVPWLVVRAVTDGLDDSLPPLVEPFRRRSCIDPETGEVIPLRMILLAVFCPRVVPKLVRLGGRAGAAARNLANFVESYLGQL